MTSPSPLQDLVQMSGQMYSSQLQRRTSRSSGSQPPCRTSRIEKPRSHHNSPRTMERRKTTTENKLYATLDDHYRMMFGMAPEEVIEDRPQPSRPVSWHPSSSQFQASRPTNYFEAMPHNGWSQQYSPSARGSTHGSDFYSLSTRNSIYEPSSHAPAYGMHRGSDESDYNWQSHQQTTPGYQHSALNTPTTEPLPWYLRQWAQSNQSQTLQSPQNGSMDFLPIQHPADPDEDMEEDTGENLVALGLYDTPEPSLSWGGLVEGTGKGLKLEETWQPPTDDEEEDDDVADDASSEASVEEPSPPLPSARQRSQQMHMSVHVKQQTPGSMEGQSFFFDEDETVSKEWWYQQLKQPSLPVQDTGLGYGWL